MGSKNRSYREPVSVGVLNIRGGIEVRIEASNAETSFVNAKVRYAVEWNSQVGGKDRVWTRTDWKWVVCRETRTHARMARDKMRRWETNALLTSIGQRHLAIRLVLQTAKPVKFLKSRFAIAPQINYLKS
jgi:hypothetical protein